MISPNFFNVNKVNKQTPIKYQLLSLFFNSFHFCEALKPLKMQAFAMVSTLDNDRAKFSHYVIFFA